MTSENFDLTPSICRQARLARDRRFDGLFFIAVRSTGIYCRPICPAKLPQEKNVTYFHSSAAAANAGFRPCLRCRPDSAPGSPQWRGSESLFERALERIYQGDLSEMTMAEFSKQLGISERYLRTLFNTHIGTSAQQFIQHHRCLLAKQLLHETGLPVQEIAIASGFNSVRRFNDAFKKQLQMTPSDVRRTKLASAKQLTLSLAYRPPFDFNAMLNFLKRRQVNGIEWFDDDGYHRSFQFKQLKGSFCVGAAAQPNKLLLTLKLDQIGDIWPLVFHLRQRFDLDASSNIIEKRLSHGLTTEQIHSGLRIPLMWSLFEGGVRAICGQQVSVTAAHNLVADLVQHLGEPSGEHFFFPSAKAVLQADLSFLKMPQARQTTLREFARWYIEANSHTVNDLLSIKGIGPWTVNYLKFRYLGEPDIELSSDLGVKHAINKLALSNPYDRVKPFRSYLTMQLWQHLSKE